MIYQSQIEQIWINLITSGSDYTIKGSAPSRPTFNHICETFRQAEEGPSSEHLPLEIKSYLAEMRIWGYYFGDNIPFPGVHPAPAIKSNLITMWQGQRRRTGYTPQFGWNPRTGEPWLVIRYFAREAFAALCGPQGAFLNRLHELTQHFTLYCERFEAEGYVLVWPEFKNRSDITNPRLRLEFERFRAFLQEWTSNRGVWSNGHKRARIDEAYQDFQKSSLAIEMPPLPEGFNY